MAGYTVYRRRIEQDPAAGHAMGRHVHHDSRSLAYPHRRTAQELRTILHPRRIPILDQGQAGSCTGNAQMGALGTDPLYATLTGVLGGAALYRIGGFTETGARNLYSAAENIDGDGPYPPQDNGSSGLSVCQAAKNAGLIAGYTHCLSLDDVLDALQTRPVIIGSNFYDSMESPDSSGLVTISPSAQVAGGHEYLARGVDVEQHLVHFDNSWGTGFGAGGSFDESWDTLDRLLHEEGDGTVSIPLTLPAPVPAPAPPAPVVTPAPGGDPADARFAAEIAGWLRERHVGANRRLARDAADWLRARGFTD